MTVSVFPYPGGKSYLAPWVIEHFPDHDCYVEAFGGSASVLTTKDRSRIEVYNDIDGDLVHFFEVLRDRHDELVEWLENTPYSRDLHERFASAWYAGERPDDDIERAGRFYYLRQSQFAGKYRTKSGFMSAKKTDHGGRYIRGSRRLEEFAERFRGVVIESKDYGELIPIYDGPDTLFYLDPPYVDIGDSCYNHGEFDHKRFVETIREIDGYAVVSYETLPEGLEDGLTVVERTESRHMSSGGHGEKKDATERLLMNFDPGSTVLFSGPEQSKLPMATPDGGVVEDAEGRGGAE